MKRSHTRILGPVLGLLLALTLAPASGFAQVPHDAVYQGRLTDTVGAPLAGPVNLKLGIFDVLSGGTALYTEDHVGVVLDDNGVFTVRVGAGSLKVGVFDRELFSSGVNRYLQVVVDDEILTPRQPLSSVPYALAAEYALVAEDVLIGDPTNNFGQFFTETSQRFTETNQRFAETNQRFAETNQRFTDIQNEINTVATDLSTVATDLSTEIATVATHFGTELAQLGTLVGNAQSTADAAANGAAAAQSAADAAAAVSIASASVNSAGVLELTLSNGTVLNAGTVSVGSDPAVAQGAWNSAIWGPTPNGGVWQ